MSDTLRADLLALRKEAGIGAGVWMPASFLARLDVLIRRHCPPTTRLLVLPDPDFEDKFLALREGRYMTCQAKSLAAARALFDNRHGGSALSTVSRLDTFLKLRDAKGVEVCPDGE